MTERALRVLVVDDEPSICQAMTLLLACHGIQVVTALTSAEAKSQLATTRFDVLMVDLRLRDTRGDLLYQEIVRVDPSFADRTLFMTGDISAEAERLIAATNCPYLRKPFDVMLAVQAIAARAGVALTTADSGLRTAD